MKHDKHSAAEEAMPFITGVGRECLNGRKLVVDESLELCFVADELRMCFIPSYVVKNAPAKCRVNYYSSNNDFHRIRTYKKVS